MKRLILAIALATALTVHAENVYYVTLRFSPDQAAINACRAKDSPNDAMEITIPTSKRFYDSVGIGQEVGWKLRMMPYSRKMERVRITVSRKFTWNEGPGDPEKTRGGRTDGKGAGR